MPPLALAQITQHQRADGDPDQAQHRHIAGREQAPDLPVAALGEHDFQPGIALTATQYAHRVRAEPFAVALHTRLDPRQQPRSEEHTSELQSLMRISYAVFCLKKTNNTTNNTYPETV